MPQRVPGSKLLSFGALLLVMGLMLNCKTNPCLTCRSLLFRGMGIGAYLSTHPKPMEVTREADGGSTYEWIYEGKEAVPYTTDPAPPGVSPVNRSSRDSEVEVAFLVLRWLSTGRRNEQVKTLSSSQRIYYYVSIRTDAQGLVQTWSCDSIRIDQARVQRD